MNGKDKKVMKRFSLYAAGLLSLLFVVAPLNVKAEEANTADTYIETSISSSKREVTVEVDAAEAVTNGKFEVSYDASALTLKSVDTLEATLLDEQESDGKVVVTFVNEEAISDGSLATLVFEATGNDGDVVEVSATTLEGYNEDEVLATGSESVSETLDIATKLTSDNTKIELSAFPITLGKGSVTVTATTRYDGKKLSSNNCTYVITDANGNTVSNGKITAAGKYTVTVTGQNDYKGTVTKNFTVTKKEVKVFGIVIATTWTVK